MRTSAALNATNYRRSPCVWRVRRSGPVGGRPLAGSNGGRPGCRRTVAASRSCSRCNRGYADPRSSELTVLFREIFNCFLFLVGFLLYGDF